MKYNAMQGFSPLFSRQSDRLDGENSRGIPGHIDVYGFLYFPLTDLLECAAKEENRRMLEQFQVTKAWGIKKYPTAMQFIYGETHR